LGAGLVGAVLLALAIGAALGLINGVVIARFRLPTLIVTLGTQGIFKGALLTFVRSTAIDLGHNLGLTVVAEGVEDAEHVSALRALDCDVAQGYHYARPMPAADVTVLLEGAAQRA